MPSSLRSVAPAALLVAVFALAGCNATVERTVSADTVAEAAADTLEGEVGQRPEMDCGDEAITYADGTEVECVLTDPSTGTEFDATVTLESVEGSEELGTSVQVADAPRG